MSAWQKPNILQNKLLLEPFVCLIHFLCFSLAVDIVVMRQGITVYPKLTSDWQSSCLSFLTTGIVSVNHHTHSKSFHFSKSPTTLGTICLSLTQWVQGEIQYFLECVDDLGNFLGLSAPILCFLFYDWFTCFCFCFFFTLHFSLQHSNWQIIDFAFTENNVAFWCVHTMQSN